MSKKESYCITLESKADTKELACEIIFLNRAPIDCNTWFTGSIGTLSSYGFPGTDQIGANDYTYCIRREVGNYDYFQYFCF